MVLLPSKEPSYPRVLSVPPPGRRLPVVPFATWTSEPIPPPWPVVATGRPELRSPESPTRTLGAPGAHGRCQLSGRRRGNLRSGMPSGLGQLWRRDVLGYLLFEGCKSLMEHCVVLSYTLLRRGLHALFGFKKLGRSECSTPCRHRGRMPGMWYTFQLCYLVLDGLQADVVIRSRVWRYPCPCIGSF